MCSITGDDPQKAKEDIVNAILLLVDAGVLKDGKYKRCEATSCK